MSIKPYSQQRLLQLAYNDCNISSQTNTFLETSYLLDSEHTEIVYVSKEKIDREGEIPQIKINQRMRSEFNIDAIYQVRN
jgi:hypothetical protein